MREGGLEISIYAVDVDVDASFSMGVRLIRKR